MSGRIPPSRRCRNGGRASTTDVEQIAHDLLQPAVTISLLAETSLLRSDLSPALRALVEQMWDEARHQIDLCHQLMSPAARSSRLVDVSDLLEAAARSASARHRTEVCVEGEDVFVIGDPVQLRRAVDNVLDNACRAARGDGRVEICARRARSVSIEVHDSGPGFGAGPAGTASLGLRIVDDIVHEHGGGLTVSDSPLGGACVRLVLPAAFPGAEGTAADG